MKTSRNYNRTAPYVRDKGTINISGLKSKPAIDTDGKTTAFHLVKVSAGFKNTWADMVAKSYYSHALIARSAIHWIIESSIEEVIAAAIDEITQRESAVSPEFLTEQFVSFKIVRSQLDALVDVAAKAKLKRTQLARGAFYRLTSMPKEQLNSHMQEYLANFQ